MWGGGAGLVLVLVALLPSSLAQDYSDDGGLQVRGSAAQWGHFRGQATISTEIAFMLCEVCEDMSNHPVLAPFNDSHSVQPSRS